MCKFVYNRKGKG